MKNYSGYYRELDIEKAMVIITIYSERGKIIKLQYFLHSPTR